MPNTSSSVPFLLSGSMQSIRSRRTSTCMSSGPLGSGSGLLHQLGSGMVRLTSNSGISSPVHHHYNGNMMAANSTNTSANNLNYPGAVSPANRGNHVRKCPSLNITFSTHWIYHKNTKQQTKNKNRKQRKMCVVWRRAWVGRSSWKPFKWNQPPFALIV